MPSSFFLVLLFGILEFFFAFSIGVEVCLFEGFATTSKVI